jgi:hypothetical protein
MYRICSGTKRTSTLCGALAQSGVKFGDAVAVTDWAAAAISSVISVLRTMLSAVLIADPPFSNTKLSVVVVLERRNAGAQRRALNSAPRRFTAAACFLPLCVGYEGHY